MIHNRVTSWLIVALAISFLGGPGCATDGDGAGSSVDVPVRGSVDSPEAACISTIDASGLVCSRCTDDEPGAAPECMAAECGVSDRCLRCVDPRGRVATDCSIDYEVLRTGSLTISPGDSYNLASCSFMWGVASASGTTCHYPGTSSCEIREEAGWHCLTCTYPDGSGNGICGDSSEPLPDPMMGRPLDLPAPGSCISDVDKDGLVSCTTCTHDDLSATRSCHHHGIIACSLVNPDEDADHCLLHCSDGGGEVSVCNSPRGPQPVGSSSP